MGPPSWPLLPLRRALRRYSPHFGVLKRIFASIAVVRRTQPLPERSALSWPRRVPNVRAGFHFDSAVVGDRLAALLRRHLVLVTGRPDASVDDRSTSPKHVLYTSGIYQGSRVRYYLSRYRGLLLLPLFLLLLLLLLNMYV